MKTALTIMTLGLSLWAIPAPATPSREVDPRGLAVASAAHSARASRHVDVHLRSDWKEVAGLSQSQASNGLAHSRSKDGVDWKEHWRESKKPGQVGSAVPEPSAMTLFGVGVLLTLQAIPRKHRTSGVDAEPIGSPEIA